MPARDPFLREWMKAPSYLLDKPAFTRLSLWHQGVFWSAALYSLKNSKIPGWLLDRHGEVLTDEEIAYGINARDAEMISMVRAALQALKEAKLMLWTRSGGWQFAPELYEDMLAANNVTAKRQADAMRARNYRARKKAPNQPARGKVVDLDTRRDAEGANQ